MNKKQDKVSEKKVTKKKTTSKKAAKAKVVKKKTTKKKSVAKKTSSKVAVISPRERYEMIATMAYYRAEARNFEPGNDVQDWLDCESTINELLKKK
ncbi:MAG: DUF2934 domain-containing protein [Candidatus Thiodiazotropha sp. 6PLUC2]